MAYNSAIPTAVDKLSTSQADLLANFQEINTYVNVDHVAFNGVDQGKHKRVFFTQQAADPATAATETALYAKDGTVPGTASIYVRPPNSGTPIDITYALKANYGWTYLPSGILMKWGTGTVGVAIVWAEVLGAPGRFTAVPYTIQITTYPGVGFKEFGTVMTATMAVTGFNTEGWDTAGNVAIPAFRYLAIGI